MSVAVDIVSGFLGSGKTSLLRHVLAGGLRDARVAVVMNEIGEIGIDGRVLTGLGGIEKLVELSSGCICCSIDEYRFDVAIQDLVETARPDLIETVLVDGAADAAARQLDELLDAPEARQHAAVDTDLTNLVHDDGNAGVAQAAGQHMS